MKTKFKSKLLSILLVLVMVLALVPVSALTAFAAERDREIVAVDSGNSFNMRLSDMGVLTWDEVAGATGYKVALLNSMGQTINEWDNTLTNSRVLQFIGEMDNSKYDSGRYTIEVIAKDTNKKASMSYYYTSNVDKLEEPHGLQWLGNQAVWEYVDGAIEYTVFLYKFEGLVASKTVTECPVDLSEYNPQDGWTFAVRAETNGALKDKRNSNIAESPKKGNGTRTVNLVDSGNALNMKVGESGVLKWDEVIGATGYQVVLKNPIGVEIYRWDNDFTNNYRMLPIITEIDNLKIDSGHYRFEVEPKGAGSVAVIANYYYTSHVEQFEAPYNLKWNGTKATWTAIAGASSYTVSLYDFNGKVKTVTVTDDWYDFSEYNLQDGWTFKVQAEGDGKSTAKRSSNATESPAKTTSYNLTVVAYGTGNLTDTGKVSLVTENGTQDFSTSVGGTFIKNTEVTVKAEANPGYEFVAWRVTAPENPEATLSTNATHTFNLTSNLQLFAVFREIPSEYSVAYHGNGATGGMTGDTVDAGGTYILKNCTYYTPYGKKFAGWAIGSADATPLKQPGDEITINADTTIYAVWENLYFTTQPTNTSGKIGTDVKLSVKIDISQVPDEDTPYIVLEVKNGENWENVAEAKRSEWNSYNDGFTVQQNSACTKEYRYKIYNGTEWIESDTFTVEFLPIIVTFVDNTHSTITEPIEVDTVGGKISKPNDPTYPGDKFDGWWANGEWDFENRTVTQDIELSASWAGRGFYGDIPNVYAKLGAKARIDLSSVNNNGSYVYIYKYDGAEWKQDVAVSGYTWYDLSASDVEKTERYKIVINSNPVIESNEFTVTWTDTLPTFDVIYSIGDGQGAVDSDYNANKEHGSTFTVSSYEAVGAIPLAGKQFDYWSIRIGGVLGTEIAQKQAGETITITADTYIVAIWKNAPTVTVSYYSIGNIVDSDMIAVGTQHVLMDAQGLDVPSGKKFKAWAIGGLGGEQKQPGDEITITEETYIYAIWEHECIGVIESGQGATCTVDGWKDYYRCECGKYYEDANCQTPISDFEAWKVGAGKTTKDHEPNADDGDCTTAITCSVCGTVTTAANATHTAGADDGDCTTAVKCTKCDKNAIEANATHTAGADDGDCTTAVKCTKCDKNAIEANATHTAGADDGDCTTAVKCTKCDKNAIEANATHTAGADDGDCTTAVKCTKCDKNAIEAKATHTGGTATCTQKAECAVCGKEYGSFGDHNYGALIEAVAEKHTKTELVASVAAHYKCSVCNEYFTSGKEATTLAELTGATPSHSYGAWQTNDDKHWKECSCGLKSEENDHVYDDTTDVTCNTCDHDRTLPHTHGNGVKQLGQSATCTVPGWNDYYKCSCGKLYTEADCTNEITDLEAWKTGAGKIEASHNYGTLVSAVTEKHTQTELVAGVAAHYHCSACGKYFTEGKVETTLEALTGTTPSHSYGDWKTDADKHWKECTCGKKADEGNHVDANSNNKCDTCDKTLSGGVTPPPHTHDYGTTWKSDGTNHWKECSCGDKKEVTAHSGGTATCEAKAKCSECNTEYGELAEHKYSEATCTAKAKCSVCGNEKGELAAHTYVDGKCACGATDPNYVPPHEHNFVEGKCECGETDPNYQPPHEHNFIEGKCECGETDPNYTPGTDTPGTDVPGTDVPGTDNPEDPDDGLSGGAIAGIVAGSVVVLGGGGFALWWFVFRKRKLI